MNDSNLDELFDTLSADIAKSRSETDSEFEKFRIALSNIFRLLTEGDTKTLRKLQGNPSDLISYILKLADSLQHSIDETYDDFLSQVASIRDLL